MMTNLIYLLICYWLFCIGSYVLKIRGLPLFNRLGNLGKLQTTHQKLDWGLWFTHRVSFVVFYGIGSIVIPSIMIISCFRPTSLSNSLGCLLYTLHCLRRLLESLFVHRYGSHRIGFLNFFAGISYYFAAPLSVFVSSQFEPVYFMPFNITVVLTIFFIFISFIQFSCHLCLSRLKKYTLPSMLWFRSLVCPHYSAEITIYFLIIFYFSESLNSLALPLLVFVFVFINRIWETKLSKQWMILKFPEFKTVIEKRRIFFW
ncbi:hypothetical protein P9112_009041 [Eukaryota sp. TZLM1-RC]